MHRSNYYNSPPSSSRRSSNHGSSSAFSPNANPNEDWTKISDLAERRRIQNRIAQRNYRKKLKRRLEDLEKRAASGSVSPEEPESLDEPSRPKPAGRSRARRANNNKSTTTNIKTEPDEHAYNYYNSPSATPAERPLSFDSSLGEERGVGNSSMFAHQCTRQLSASPPPVFSYSSYSHLNPYGQQPAYGPSPPLYSSPSFQSTVNTTTNTTATTPSSFHDLQSFASDYTTGPPAKRVYADEEILSPFSMSYASMAGIDLGPHLHQSHLSVSPGLGHGHGHGHAHFEDLSTSTPSTPADMPLVHPLTPESDPCSPRSFPLF